MIEVNKTFVRLPSRDTITNKGDAGKVLVVGGDVGMCGAVAFASESAYRMGAGLVRAYIHSENRIPMQILVPEAVLGFWEEESMTYLSECLLWADVVIVGVGLGEGDYQKKLLEFIIKNSHAPLIIDADGLNIISKNRNLFSDLPENVILTPHLAELSRLTGESIEKIKPDIFDVLRRHFGDKKINICAKSSTTAILLSDGKKLVSKSGDSSLSTGGTGDVLVGMIASIIAQRVPIFDALPMAVYLHGLAGKSAGEELGCRSVMARDVIAHISKVI